MIESSYVKQYTKNLSILFVEDHADIRESTADILKSIFSTVETAEDGTIALKKYNNYFKNNAKHYDMILSDIQMPNMDGIELTEKVYEINPSQAIIILSAHDDSKYLLSLINLGIEQFIKKPIVFENLLRTFLNVSHKITQKQNVDESATTVTLAKNTIYDTNSKSIITDNTHVNLTKFEIVFIELLLTNIGKVHSNDDIVGHYSSLNETIDAANIRKLVSKLRKKVPENVLESIYGVGYKLIPYIKE